MKSSTLRKIAIIFLFVLLIFLSVFPRSVEVINRNYLFLLDQGRDYLAVKDIVVNRKLTLIGAEAGYGVAGMQGLFHGPFYFYLLAIPFILFRGDPYGGLLLMFLFGILAIGIGFVAGKRLFGLFGGIVTALLIAVSPPLIAQSRFAWSPHPSTLFILLAFHFTFLSFQGRALPIFLASFFSGFLYNFEMAIVVPMTLGLLIFGIFIAKFRKIRQYILLFGGIIASCIPLALFEIRHGFQGVRGLISYLFSKEPEAFTQGFSQEKFLYEKFSWILRMFVDTFPKQELSPHLFLLFIFLLGLLYFISREKEKQLKCFVVYLLWLFVITIVTFMFVRTHIFEYYVIHLNLSLILLFSYILTCAFKKNDIRFQILLGSSLIVFLYFSTLHAFNTFQKDLPDYGGMAKVRGKIDAIDYIYNDAKGGQFGLLVFTPPVYTFAYDYLVWWYGERKYGYLPHQNKKGVFYLLIEKDLSKQWTYKGWIETVIKSGKVIETRELPSGFIVQKRVE